MSVFSLVCLAGASAIALVGYVHAAGSDRRIRLIKQDLRRMYAADQTPAPLKGR